MKADTRIRSKDRNIVRMVGENTVQWKCVYYVWNMTLWEYQKVWW